MLCPLLGFGASAGSKVNRALPSLHIEGSNQVVRRS